MIVFSSENRRHLYWRLAKPIPAVEAVLLNRRIAKWAGGDSGKAGLATILRAPQTYNYKRYPRVDKVVGEITGVSPWEPEVIHQAIPPLPEPAEPKSREPYDGPLNAGIDLMQWLYASGVAVLGQVPDDKGLKLAIICPWLERHTGRDQSGTYVGQYLAEDGSPNGPTWFFCNHAHCEGRGWAEFRAKVEPLMISGRRSKSNARRVWRCDR